MYWFRFSRLDCDEEATGESSRTFDERHKEHLKAPYMNISPIQTTTQYGRTLA